MHPVDRQSERKGTWRVEDQVEEGAIVVIGLEPVVEVWLESSIDVPVIQFSVQRQEQFVCANKVSNSSAEREEQRTCRG